MLRVTYTPPMKCIGVGCLLAEPVYFAVSMLCDTRLQPAHKYANVSDTMVTGTACSQLMRNVSKHNST
jgi:hypothetical protein